MDPRIEAEVLLALGRVEGKQDLLLAHLEDQQTRISRVETKVNYGAGVLGTLTFSWPFAWAYLKSRIGLS